MVYSRFRRWTMRGIWRRLFDALARTDPVDGQAIDSTTAKGSPFGGGRLLSEGLDSELKPRARSGNNKVSQVLAARIV